jgi:beta-lactamase superfamily II metal-dependent hydrolase
VLRGRGVGEIVVGPLDEPAEERERVVGWAADAGVRIRRAVVGEVTAVGDLRIAVLGPMVAFRGTASDPNNSSLVLRVTVGRLALLLTGDIEQPAQRAALATGSALRADLLKVPHHGSDRQVADLLAAVGARVAVTSVGADNPYGHPSPQTLARLADAGLRSYRTDVDGDIAVVGGASVRVVGRRGRGVAPRPRVSFAPARPADMWCPVPPYAAGAGPRAPPSHYARAAPCRDGSRPPYLKRDVRVTINSPEYG